MTLSRPLELTIGLLSNWLMVKGFDYLLYPYVIYRLGVVRGGLVMALLSLVVCLLTLLLYDWSGRDWIGIESVKGMKDYDGPSRTRRWFSQLLRRADGLAFVVLSLRYDPFVTTAYLRHGRYSGLAARDWRNFLGSLVVSNLSWAMLCWGGTAAVKALRR